jgi:hypothetical protein
MVGQAVPPALDSLSAAQAPRDLRLFVCDSRQRFCGGTPRRIGRLAVRGPRRSYSNILANRIDLYRNDPRPAQFATLASDRQGSLV